MKRDHPPVRKLWSNGRWDLVCVLVGSRLVPNQIRRAVLRRMCEHIGDSRICADFRVNHRWLHIGDDVFINERVTVDCQDLVTIEDNVAIGPGCTIITSGHHIGPPERRRRGIDLAPVRIEKGSWLATNVTVLPGATIGSGCVIAAGAVVRGDLAPNGFYAGVPARRVRDLGDNDDVAH